MSHKPVRPKGMNGEFLHLSQMVEWLKDEIDENRKSAEKKRDKINGRVDSLFKRIVTGIVSGPIGLLTIVVILITVLING